MANQRALIVEDNPLICELLAELLADDFEVLTAPNGERGIALALERRPDVILMDLMMPVMDGWEAIRRLRATWATCRIPIISLSALGDEGEVTRAKEAGADAHLRKPIDEAALGRVLRRLVLPVR